VAISRSISLLVAGIVAGLMNAIVGDGTIALIFTGNSFGVGFAITAVMFHKQIVRS
jgi:hypothetical protein